jgi:hypothetical protein
VSRSTRFYQQAFKSAISGSPVSAAQSRSHHIFLQLFTELQGAKQAVEFAAIRYQKGHGYFDPLLVAWLRAYRAIEWCESELGLAVADAVTSPFSEYLNSDSKVRASEFFRPAALKALLNAVLNAAFDPAPFVATLKAFYEKHRQIRHAVVHGTYQPKMDETKELLTDAIAIYTPIDNQLNPMNPTPLSPPYTER